MGTPYKSYRADRRKCQPVIDETERGSETTNRREVLRVGNKRIYVRGSEGILLPPDQRSESDETGNCPTCHRVDHVEGRNASTVGQVPHTDIYDPVHVRTGSSKPGGSASVFGMSSLSIRRKVLFVPDVSVFTPTDWPADVYRDARKGYWIQAAVDRKRFERRIKQTELELGDIFTNEHRERYCCFL
jgi:hypothetical protein